MDNRLRHQRGGGIAIRMHKLAASGLGIGYIGGGGGTAASIAACTGWYFLFREGVFSSMPWQPLLTAAAAVLCIWSAGVVEAFWGKDDRKVVLDEMAGMGVSLLFLPVAAGYLLAALILFRFFDIAKPLFIRKAEGLGGGWGVVADDLLAGLYTNIILHAVFYLSAM